MFFGCNASVKGRIFIIIVRLSLIEGEVRSNKYRNATVKYNFITGHYSYVTDHL
jgi:hypothetical protein